MSLRPWQTQSVQHLLGCLSRHGAAADLSDPGTGKTYTATAIAKALNRPTLVVSPKAVIPTWHRVAAFLGTEFDVLNYEKLRTGNTEYGTWGREARQRKDRFRWHPGIGFLIFDEAHRCAGLTTKQGEMLMAAKRQGIPTLILSATLADTPLELKAAGYVLGLHDGDETGVTLDNFRRPPIGRSHVGFYQWARRHKCGPGHFSAFKFLGSKFDQEVQMAKIHASLIPERGCRVRIADLGEQFPETQISPELYEIADNAKVDALYTQMASAMDRLGKKSALDRDPEHPLTKLLRLRQEVELLKVPIFAELALDALSQGQSVAIFVNFTQTIQELCHRLKTSCIVDGSQAGDSGARERAACVDAFQADQERIIVCNSESGGVGLSLHDLHGSHPRLSLISPGYSAKIFRQVVGRVHRSGGRTKSLQRVICIAGTVEETLANSLEHKLSRLDALTDGDLFPRR